MSSIIKDETTLDLLTLDTHNMSCAPILRCINGDNINFHYINTLHINDTVRED
jgi:hypothetical protein